MRLLVQTSSAQFGLGLMGDDGQVRHRVTGAARSRDLGALLRDLLDLSGCPLADLREICVDLGPGGLSATRAGVSFANALGYAGQATLTGVSSLDLLTLAARDRTDRPVCALRPAQGGLAFWTFDIGGRRLAAGCDLPGPVLTQLVHDHGALAVVGPLARVRLDAEEVPDIQHLDIDPPDMAHFARAPRRAAQIVQGVAQLAPITAPEALGPLAPPTG